ncbi:MAG: hydantoinase B/oxoprolinase family protein [Candidatus Saccharicenans sp.]|jgi:N-methylhydantoinase B/oxoprolinase/acetone carboxylase alpha subunit|nr:hydantoinase B/oxoprolinase family protein [Candidatus Saccharicenans sp.]MDH7494073.1 hydantoinase B/oxoprolinase family protein [Candidatus Saccharicenans sp.]
MKLFDPIELELFKNLFTSITEEMAAVLQRTALSPNIKERRDFSCALFTRLGETFAQGSHIPVHLGAMPLSVQSALQAVEFHPGDVVILNDPYRGGTHLPDITCIQPYFVGDNLCFLVANRAHHSDVGGLTPGSMPLATEIFQEGVIIPPLKLYQRGRLNEEVLSLLLANVRTPEERRGDILAQVAANSRGARRLGEMLNRYGLEKLTLYADQVQDYTEKILRATIESIPDGHYEFEDFLDDDGFNNRPVKIRVALTIKDDEAWVDFSGSAAQVSGSVNANFAVTYSAVLYVFRSLVEEDIPFNTGLMKPVHIIAPEGSVVNATFPSALAGGNVETSQRIVDVLLGALARAIPDRIPAASQGTMNNIACGGFNPRTRTSFAYYETIGGGLGASATHHGLSGVHCHMTNSLNTPIEALENYLPLKIRRYSLRKNSGGRGWRRGGDGLIREYQFLVPVNLTIISDRRKLKPYGLAGGQPGRAGINLLIRKGRRKVLASKVNLKLEAGDILRIETPGGGGYGPVKG